MDAFYLSTNLIPLKNSQHITNLPELFTKTGRLLFQRTSIFLRKLHGLDLNRV